MHRSKECATRPLGRRVVSIAFQRGFCKVGPWGVARLEGHGGHRTTRGSRRSSWSSWQRLADFPRMSVAIDDSSDSPAMLVANRPDHVSSCSHRPLERRPRIVHRRYHSHRSTTERLQAEALVLGRLVRQSNRRGVIAIGGDSPNRTTLLSFFGCAILAYGNRSQGLQFE